MSFTSAALSAGNRGNKFFQALLVLGGERKGHDVP